MLLAAFVRENFMARTAVNANFEAIMVSRIINGGVLIPQRQYLYHPPKFMKHCKRRDKKNEPEHGEICSKKKKSLYISQPLYIEPTTPVVTLTTLQHRRGGAYVALMLPEALLKANSYSGRHLSVSSVMNLLISCVIFY